VEAAELARHCDRGRVAKLMRLMLEFNRSAEKVEQLTER
jgi:hypothetical protein